MAEMIALWDASQCSSWLGIEWISIFGDSLNLIQWTLGHSNLGVSFLCNWMNRIRDLKVAFSNIFQHIPEQNLIVDALSKQGLSLSLDFIHFEYFATRSLCGQGFFEFS